MQIKLEVLVSTMNQTNFNLIKTMNMQTDAVIINQGNYSSIKNIVTNNFNIKWINSTERGLSRSRNMAIENATAEICIIADDDLEYLSNYEDIILKQFKANPNTDIIAFQVEGIESKFKNYYKKERRISYLTSMKISSVEIAFRLDKIKEHNMKFNELFGSGSKYFAGEEIIFLWDCLKKGLTIKYAPIKIADLHTGNSSWFTGFDREYFITKGAGFTAMSRLLSFPLILQFAIRKYNLYGNTLTMFQVIQFMLKGRKSYLKGKD